ncbi:MAG TPA: YCF48-related protein [Solirubrobacteraceae bacterium]|jgi:photosystem II stability/assembly factor-like uncharacterized protein|nr:YCF48-related protein [Solirubrobacteraceae bacterium]
MTRARSRHVAVAIVLASALAAGAALAAASSVSVSSSGWSWGNPSPQGNKLNAIDFLNATTGFAAGDNGTALRTDDAGATWSGLATGTAGQLTRLQIVNANTLVVGGGAGCVLRRSADGGKTFTRIFVPTETNCPDKVQAFSFVDPQTGFLLLTDGSVLVTHDGGQSFTRETAVPGTAAASGGGNLVPEDVHFTTATSGLVFLTTGAAQGSSSAYFTTDGGVSWKPVGNVDSGTVTRMYFLDPLNGYATGPNTLLRTTDGGNTWKSMAAGANNTLTSIRCSDPSTCLLTVAAGDKLLRTTDGGATVNQITPSSSPLHGVAFATSSRVVAVGDNGTTVVSNDGGVNYSAVSGDIGGQYFRLRLGANGIVLAAGAKGQVARSDDGGATWHALSTASSVDLRDVAFSSPTVGYALGSTGTLQTTANGGVSWTALDPGPGGPANALVTAGSNVLLIGPQGVRVAPAGGRFTPVTAKLVKNAPLNDAQAIGSTVFAFSSKAILVSPDGGGTWSAIKPPATKRKGHRHPVTIHDISFTSAANGFVLDTASRVWSTQNAGRRWTEITSTGTSDALGIAFSDPSSGFISLSAVGAATGEAAVLHTSDAGHTWRPQLISSGLVTTGGVLAASPVDAYALVVVPGSTPTSGRALFFTHSGGDAGQPSQLTIGTAKAQLTRQKLRKAKSQVTITGTLSGATGGEQIIVSRRDQAGGVWQQKVVTAGVNGGSFTASFKMTRSSLFVAQWAGDSGRQSVGTPVLTVKVK